MITMKQLKDAKWSVVMLDGSGFWERRAVCTDFPGLEVIDRGPRGRSTTVTRARQIIYRGELYETFAAVLAAITSARLASSLRRTGATHDDGR